MATDTGAAPALTLRRELGLTDLILFNVVATLGVQLVSVFAHVGPVSIPLHIAAAVLWFVPCAIVIAGLSRQFPGEGGFYLWSRHYFGDWHGFLCGWTWWLSVLLYLPGLVLMGVSMGTQAAGARAAALADSVPWQITFAVCVLWLCVGLNILGLRVSKWLSNIGGSLIYAGGLLVSAACIVIWLRKGSATHFNFAVTLSAAHIGLWAQIAFAYTGLELGSLMGGEVRNPRKTIPRAVWIGAAAVAAGYIAGAALLMLVLPPDNINPMSGLVQVASLAGDTVGIPLLGPIAGILMFLGVLGKVSTWAGGSARLPFIVGLDGALPAAFTRLHPRFRTPWVALLTQGVACTVFLLIAQSGESLRNGWQSLMDMTILITFVPYVYIFLCGWKSGHRLAATSGLFVTLVAMAFSMVPPEGSASPLSFECKVVGGCLAMIFAGWLAYRYSTRRNQIAIAAAAALLLFIPLHTARAATQDTQDEIVELGPGVVPPKVLRKMEPVYTEDARRAGMQGTVLLQIVIDSAGFPKNIEVLSPLGYGLDENAIATVSQWRFQPATKNGRPVAFNAKVQVNFRLNSNTVDSTQEDKRTRFNVIISRMSRDPDGKPKDSDIKSMQDLARHHYAAAEYAMGLWQIQGSFVPKDVPAGLSNIRSAADQKYGKALYYLGVSSLNGKLIPKDHARGLVLLDAATQAGIQEAQLLMGQIFENGSDAEPADPARAKKYYRLCAASGAAKCQFYLGRMLLTAPDAKPKDRLEAVAWLQLSDNKNLAEAHDLAAAESAKLTSRQTESVLRLRSQLEHQQR